MARVHRCIPLLLPFLLLAGCGSEAPAGEEVAGPDDEAAANAPAATAEEGAEPTAEEAGGEPTAEEASGESTVDDAAPADSAAADDSSDDVARGGPFCEVTGSFTPDAEAYGDEVPTLEDIGATELPAYELTGMADYERWWTDAGSGGGGAKGPWTLYFMAFHDGELGYRVDFQVFPESPLDSVVEVRRFTDPITFYGEPPGEVITWQGLPEDRVLGDLAPDGSGGTMTFSTTRGGIGATEFFYPLRVELEFDCPEGAFRES